MIKCSNGACEKELESCCSVCPEKSTCEYKCDEKSNPIDCGYSIFEGTALEVFNSTSAALISGIADLLQKKVEIESAEKSMREQLTAAMEEHGVDKIEHDILKINYIKPTTRTSVDSKKLNEMYPHIYAECSKTSNVKGYVKIELKGGKS